MEINSDRPKNITSIDINREMREAYLQYSMSVIVGRALPDVRDGLKPVHRRVLFAMNDLGNVHNKPYKKSARIVGDVIGKYHPHSDKAVYDTIVRMAQDFSMRFPLIDGQGNFGSIDGDPPAAQRYTEIRMTALVEEFLQDIDKETVEFGPNYDDSLLIPLVLPSKVPNLLINGSSGIAVGMATNIPPHNLGEVVDACIHLIENPDCTIDDLMGFVPGPDFPTSGIISGTNGIHSAYKKGKGIITLKAVSEIVPIKGDREEIIISEIPYQVNKAKLIESIADLVRDKKIEGITDIRDESSREGMRIVISLRRNENAQVVLNRLYKFTQLQVSFGIIMLALDAKNQPKVFTLKGCLEAFIEHRRNVVTRRCIFDLKKAEARAHILEGLNKALDEIDRVISVIRSSNEALGAKEGLISEFNFSEKQAQAILEMRLQRLTGLERDKIINDLQEINKTIDWLKYVLGRSEEIDQIIRQELNEIRDRYNNPRKSKIENEEGDFDDEDLIAKEEMIVTLTHSGSIKRISPEEYRVQKRGGKGLKGEETREDDFVERLFIANTLTNLLVFTDRGKLFWTKVYKVPLGKRTTKGRSIANLVQLGSGERVMSLLPVEVFKEDHSVVMVTKKGIIKKTSMEEFSRPRNNGLIALTTDQGDELMIAQECSPKDEILIVTKEGMSIRFNNNDVRTMGRTARGVKGITLGSGDYVVGTEVIPPDCGDTLLIVTTHGFGKRTSLSEYRTQSRGGVGIITQKVADKVGFVVSAKKVKGNEHIVITTDSGQTIRVPCSDISVVGRNTLGVKLINLKDKERVTGIALIEDEEAVSDI